MSFKPLFITLFLVGSAHAADQHNYRTWNALQQLNQELWNKVHDEFGHRYRITALLDVCGKQKLIDKIAPKPQEVSLYVTDALKRMNRRELRGLQGYTPSQLADFAYTFVNQMAAYSNGYRVAVTLHVPVFDDPEACRAVVRKATELEVGK